MLLVTAFAFAQDPATFEDVQLGGSGIWVAPEEGENELPSGGWIFTNYNYTSWGYWGGFTASNRTDLNQSGLDAQYTAAAGCGYDGSSQYAVSYTMGVQTEVYAADGQSHTVTGCYVTNNLWTYQDILQGGYGEPPYGGTTGNDPDWFKVTATGKNASGQVVGTLDFYLADYRFSNNEEDYVLNTWEWFDLSPLGSVATISFDLSSSRGSGYNMITPAYFCMDNFNGGGAAPDLPPYIVNPVQDVVFNEYPQTIQVNLDGVATDPDDPDENITYSIINNSNPSALTATMNGKILVMTRQNANQATANLTIRATSDGQYVDFTVHVIINVVVDEPPVIANPVSDVVFNEYPQTIQVNLDGVATDPDDPDENITYNIVSNSNQSALTATMNGKILIMTRQNANQATADLTMRATSDGQYVDFNVHVIINAVIDEPPVIVNPVSDVVFDEYPQTIQVNLDGVATDPDDPDEDIVYSIVNNSNSTALTATMNDKILVMTRLIEGHAIVNLTVRATSDGQYVDFTVHVIINSVVQQLCGTYIIDADVSQQPDYTSFSEAVEALAAGVSCEVVFEVAPGTYEEFVTLGPVTGASATNRVIFRGIESDKRQVVLTSNAGYSQNSTLTLDGADYVSFENMTIASTSENNAVVVTLRGGLVSDRFENVRFEGCYSEATNTDNDKNLVYRVSGGWMDTDNAFTDCEFVNGFIGLYYQGTDMTQFNDGLVVENCIFTDQCSKAIYATFTDHVILRGNVIENTNDSHTDFNAIDMFRCRYGCLVENNVMTVNHPTKYSTVVKLRPCTGTAAEPVIVRNNIVDLQCDASSSWCYSFDNADSDHIYFAHNTGRCSGMGASGNLMVQKEWSNLYVYNNLFVNETDGYVFRFNNESTGRYCDYNRVSFTGSFVGVYAGADCGSLEEWSEVSGFDAQSAVCEPQFVGNGDLHLTSPEGLIVAHPLDYVTTDFEGETRPATPCAGADEYNEAYAVGEWESEGSLVVYPNPSQGVVTVSVEGDFGFEYQVFDMTGRMMLRGRCENQEALLDMSGAGKGVYLISVTCDSKHLMRKVIVQ